jgi:hypothetical protein
MSFYFDTLKGAWPASLPAPSPAATQIDRNARPRLDSIDLLRGLVMIYPLCRWFADLKRRRNEWWWSYL